MSTTEVEYRVRVHQPTGEIRVEWRPTQQAREAKRRKMTRRSILLLGAGALGFAAALVPGFYLSWAFVPLVIGGATLSFAGVVPLATRGEVNDWNALRPTPHQAAAQTVLGSDAEVDDDWSVWAVPADQAPAITKAWEDTKACQEQKSRDAAQEALERAAAGKERVRADAK